MGVKAPVYEGIKQELRGKIERGELKQGERVPSELGLAKLLGVNRSQTRQALRELEVEGYLIRKQGSGSYVAPQNPNSVVKVANVRTIAIVIPKRIIGHSSRVVEGFMQRASETEGLQVISYSRNFPQSDDASEVHFLRSVVDSGVSGVVAWIRDDADDTHAYVRELAERRYPLVLVDRHLPDVDTDFVVTDNEALGCELTCALLRHGHKRIAFCGMQHPMASSVQGRLAGYRRALQEASIPFDESLVMDADHIEDAPLDELMRVMALCERPTAIVAIDTLPVYLLLHPLEKLGFRLGENIDIATVDDDLPQGLPEAPLIRMAQQGREIGAESAELLLARMADPDGLVQRRFVRPGALTDPTIQQRTRESSAENVTE